MLPMPILFSKTINLFVHVRKRGGDSFLVPQPKLCVFSQINLRHRFSVMQKCFCRINFVCRNFSYCVLLLGWLLLINRCLWRRIFPLVLLLVFAPYFSCGCLRFSDDRRSHSESSEVRRALSFEEVLWLDSKSLISWHIKKITTAMIKIIYWLEDFVMQIVNKKRRGTKVLHCLQLIDWGLGRK